MKSSLFFIVMLVVFATIASSLRIRKDDIATIRKKNADDAEALTKKFKSFTKDTPCKAGDLACIGDEFAECATVPDGSGFKDKYVLFKCGPTLKCVVLPLVLKRGTSITCDTEADRKARLEQARKNE